MELHVIMFFILLFLATVFLYLLPFLPALLEWINRTDVEPFNVVFEDNTLFDYFVRMFRIHMQSNYTDIINKYMNTGENHQGVDPKGQEYQFIGKTGLISLSAAETMTKATSRLFILWQDAILPDGMTFKNKIYARGKLTSGQNNRLLEVLAEGDLNLNESTVTERLVFGGQSIVVGKRCVINGYIKAKDTIVFEGMNEFQSICAKNICFGRVVNQVPTVSVDILGTSFQRIVERRDYKVVQGTQVSSHFVVYGTLNIENACNITGSIKCYENLYIGHNTRIAGAVVCEKDIYIGDNCFIQGPIISNGTIVFGNHCIIGASNTTTSVLAENITVGTGCYFTGILLAKVQGNYSADAAL